jgi:hypothetical protein
MALKNPLNSLGLTSSPGSLQDFYNKIGSNFTLQKDNFANYINVPKFFSVSIQNFKPSPEPIKSSEVSWLDAPIQKLGEALESGLNKLIDNFVDNQNFEVLKDTLKKGYSDSKGNKSLIVLLAEYMGINLESDFKFYVQDIKLPSIKIDTEFITNFSNPEPIGTDGTFILPENNNITINVLDMAAPLHEYIFYPWMSEVGLNQWVYPYYPFTKADIYINFMFPNYTNSDGSDDGGMVGSIKNKAMDTMGEFGKQLLEDPLSNPSFRYIFKNCYPTRMELLNPSNTINTTFTRAIDFAFSHIVIETSGITKLSATKKLVGALSNRVINPVMNKGLQPITGNSIIPSTSL